MHIAVVANNGSRLKYSPKRAHLVLTRGWGRLPEGDITNVARYARWCEEHGHEPVADAFPALPGRPAGMPEGYTVLPVNGRYQVYAGQDFESIGKPQTSIDGAIQVAVEHDTSPAVVEARNKAEVDDLAKAKAERSAKAEAEAKAKAASDEETVDDTDPDADGGEKSEAEGAGSSDATPGGAEDAGATPDPEAEGTEAAAGSPVDKVARPEDPEALPPGYTAEKSGPRSSYFILSGPDGSEVPGPSNGKWQGADGAAQGAWDHYGS